VTDPVQVSVGVKVDRSIEVELFVKTPVNEGSLGGVLEGGLVVRVGTGISVGILVLLVLAVLVDRDVVKVGVGAGESEQSWSPALQFIGGRSGGLTGGLGAGDVVLKSGLGGVASEIVLVVLNELES
jgi:hypothetical protein